MNVLINYEYRKADVENFPVEELAIFAASQEHKPENTEISISFVDNDTIAQLNEEYRGKRGPTDVLSFECDGVDNGFGDAGADANATYELGDVVIAVDVAERQTKEFGTTLEQEISLLLVHSILHLCGYDHIRDDEAQIMESREDAILKAWCAR